MPRERKRRAHYPPSDALPKASWVPPTSPTDTFECVATKCRLSADACCRRQNMTIVGTPEPRFPFCHPDCVQGRMVLYSMPPKYVPRKAWGKTGRAKGPKANGFAPQVDGLRDRDPSPGTPPKDRAALFAELHSLVAPVSPTRDECAPLGTLP